MSEQVPRQTVVIELTIHMLLECPETWDSEDVEFYLNDSSHCLSTELRELYNSDIAGKGSCDICHRAEGKFLHTATPDDLENLKLRKVVSCAIKN